MGDYRRVGPGECTCPLASVTAFPRIDPNCPVHGPQDSAVPARCICAFQETNRDCPIHGAERKAQLARDEPKLEAPRIHRNALEQFVIVHPTFPLAWSGKKWVPAINGLPVGGVQICNFKTKAEAFNYCTEHFDAITLELSVLADEIAKQVGLEASGVARPDHWADPPPDPNAFRCPFCGDWRPAYGLSGQHAEVPDRGRIEFVTFYCGSCRAVLAINVTKQDSGLSIATGFPPGFPRKH
jgi:hypothetical protein